jgi:hypothetical protein
MHTKLPDTQSQQIAVGLEPLPLIQRITSCMVAGFSNPVEGEAAE